MSLRVGSIGYCVCQGLGILLKSFYDAGVVTDVMTVAHGRRPEHPEWFPSARRITDLKSDGQRADMEAFCGMMDVMMFFETPFHWPLIDFCRRIGVKTVLMPMFECMPRALPAQPDYFICPSLLDLRYFPDRSEFIPVPVDPTTWWKRTKAEVFVHNAGHGGLKGRNGTAEVIESLKFIKNPARIIIRSQDPIEWRRVNCGAAQVELKIGTVPTNELYATGDVFLFPERFNGLSLPLQEARAAGMLVMCGDRFPMNQWLPHEPLIPVANYTPDSVSPRCLSFERANIRPEDIAAKIDEVFGADIGDYSESGRVWAEANSWTVLKPRYMGYLERVVRS